MSATVRPHPLVLLGFAFSCQFLYVVLWWLAYSVFFVLASQFSDVGVFARQDLVISLALGTTMFAFPLKMEFRP